ARAVPGGCGRVPADQVGTAAGASPWRSGCRENDGEGGDTTVPKRSGGRGGLSRRLRGAGRGGVGEQLTGSGARPSGRCRSADGRETAGSGRGGAADRATRHTLSSATRAHHEQPLSDNG